MKTIIIIILLTAVTAFGMSSAKQFMGDLVASRAVAMAQVTK